MNSDEMNEKMFSMMQKRNQQDIEFRARNAKNCIDSPLSDPIAKSKAAWDLYILHDRGLAGLSKDQDLALQYLQYSAQLGNLDAREELERLNTDIVTRNRIQPPRP